MRLTPTAVLVDDPVDAAVIGELGLRRLAVGAAVAHGHQQIEDCLLKEQRILSVEPAQQVVGEVGMDTRDARLNLLSRVELGIGLDRP